MFSKQNVKKLLLNFGLTLVNHDDPTAYRYLKQLMREIEKFGKIESLREKIEKQLKSFKGIISIVLSIATLAGILWDKFG